MSFVKGKSEGVGTALTLQPRLLFVFLFESECFVVVVVVVMLV